MVVGRFASRLKAGSSKWVHDTFANQLIRVAIGVRGIFGFEVEPDVVKEYIADQPRHHQSGHFRMSFALLRLHDLTWDERYVWD